MNNFEQTVFCLGCLFFGAGAYYLCTFGEVFDDIVDELKMALLVHKAESVMMKRAEKEQKYRDLITMVQIEMVPFLIQRGIKFGSPINANREETEEDLNG